MKSLICNKIQIYIIKMTSFHKAQFPRRLATRSCQSQAHHYYVEFENMNQLKHKSMKKRSIITYNKGKSTYFSKIICLSHQLETCILNGFVPLTPRPDTGGTSPVGDLKHKITKLKNVKLYISTSLIYWKHDNNSAYWRTNK